MSFRLGSNGVEVWEQCRKQGIAAMGYYYNGEPVVGDCRNITEKEFDAIWRESGVRSRTGKSSLKHVVFHMKEGDVIYAKKGTEIVGKGKIAEEYDYKPGIVKQDGVRWEHYVKVDWNTDFKPFVLDLSANQHTVLKINQERLARIREKEYGTDINLTPDIIDEVASAEEGKKYIREASFRQRNRKLIEQKKANSDYRCEVCGMRYEDVYGEIGKDYIIAHHLEPIGNRDEAAKTTLDDIALVCSNCHDMLHKTNPPMSIEELRTQLYQ
ncbi:HNH endonuclease [Methanolobus tindarius]|nr:HNH endonuclease [Methanolobus tindarius]